MVESKNILVTGGAGYVGYSVVEALSRKYPNNKIIIYDNFSKSRLENISKIFRRFKNVEIIPWERADIRDSKDVEKAMEMYKPKIVIHLAAIVNAFSTNREGKDRETKIVNHEAAVSVAKIAKKHGVEIFINQCTVSLYSRGENLTEEAKKEPLSMYGKAKLLAEKDILKLSDKSFKVVSLRPATVTGYNPCFRYETIINLCCVRSIYKMPVTIFESAMYGEKSYLYVKDNAKVILFAIDNIEKLNGQSYNVSSFNTNLDIVLKVLKKCLKEDFPYKMAQEKSISQQVYTVSSEKIRKAGFIPSGKIDRVVKEAIYYLKKNRAK